MNPEIRLTALEEQMVELKKDIEFLKERNNAFSKCLSDSLMLLSIMNDCIENLQFQLLLK